MLTGAICKGPVLPLEPGLASRSLSMWVFRSSIQSAGAGAAGPAAVGGRRHDVGSRARPGGGRGCLFVDAGPGPGPGQTQLPAFPATCPSSQPSLWWPDSWQPGCGSELPAPSPRDQRECPSVPAAGCGGQPPGVEAGAELYGFISAFSPASLSSPISDQEPARPYAELRVPGLLGPPSRVWTPRSSAPS